MSEPRPGQVVGVALDSRDAADLIAEMGGLEQPYFELLCQSIPPSGRLLGYEIVGAEPTLDFHSWHCHGYADALLATHGIRLNELGLFATYTEARAGLEWMTALPPREASKPVLWCVVALFTLATDHS